MKKDPREITSSLTHFFGAVTALAGTVKMVRVSLIRGGTAALVSVLVFGASMTLLYSTSSIYHWCCAVKARAEMLMQRLDHMAIFLLIAGTYTPICIVALGRPLGYIMLALVWGAAAAGLFMKIFWMNAPVWLSCAVYITLGWLALFFAVPLARALTIPEMVWLTAGGVLYTAGALVFGFERPRLKLSWFGPHELFHLFVIGGSVCHYITITLCLG